MAIYTIDNIPSNLKNGDIINCDYSGIVKSCTLPKGTYKLECWGAEGGCYSTYSHGNGGYSVGTVNTLSKVNIYIYCGGKGESNASSTYSTSGFNGGGHPASGTYGSSGGGGTDIRIGQDSLYARVIVAGGGGGSAAYSSNSSQGSNGYGGGFNGGSISSGSANCAYGLGGSQTAGGYTGSNGVSPKETYRGQFGIGGYGNGEDSSGYGNAGGGGGWYGGGGGNANAAGGGSGYVYTSLTASNYPSGCLLDPSYYLTDAQTIAGNQTFTSPSGTSETGHTGNGYVRITVLYSYATPLFAKVSNEWKEINKSYIKIGSEWWIINSAYEKNKQTQKWRSIY